MVDVTIYKGVALDEERFSAAAFLDAEESADEPGTSSVLLTNEIGEGWTRVDVAEDRVTDMMRLGGHVFAVSERGRVYSPLDGQSVADLSGVIPSRLSSAIGDPLKQMTVIGDHGYFYSGDPDGDFAAITTTHERGELDNNMTLDEEDRYFEQERYVYGADGWPSGDLVLTQIGGLAYYSALNDTLSLSQASVTPVAVAARSDGTAVAVGHSPRVTIFRFVPTEGLSVLFGGATRARQTGCIAVHDDAVFVGDSHPESAGVYRLDSAGLLEVPMPAEFGSAPVYDLDTYGEVLWVFRAKDVLRLKNGNWDRMTPNDTE